MTSHASYHHREGSSSMSPVRSVHGRGERSRAEGSQDSARERHRDRDSRAVDWPASPPSQVVPIPTPMNSSRMSLSALVNSPPGSPAQRLPTNRHSASASTSTSRGHYDTGFSHTYRSPSLSPPRQHSRAHRTSAGASSREHVYDYRHGQAAPQAYSIDPGQGYGHDRAQPAHLTSTPEGHHSYSRSAYPPASSSLDYTPVASSSQIFYNSGPPPTFPALSHSHAQRGSISHLPPLSGGGPSRHRSPSPVSASHGSTRSQAYPGESVPLPTGAADRRNGLGRAEPLPLPPPPAQPVAPPPPSATARIAYRLGDRLVGNEDVWEEALKAYQMKREAEVALIAQYDPASYTSPRKSAKKGARKTQPLGAASTNDADASSVAGTEDAPTSAAKPPQKRKGWPADHPTRIAQREAREAAILAAGGKIPPRRPPRKSKTKAAVLEDELLGLAEGGQGGPDRSSPVPGSELNGADDETDGGHGDGLKAAAAKQEPVGPDTIVHPCGLTRAEVIRKIENADMDGLTEADVKQVQDEMWVRAKESAGGVSIRKDGTLRRKPGPAKGWKQMRGEDVLSRRKKGNEAGITSTRGEQEEDELDSDQDQDPPVPVDTEGVAVRDPNNDADAEADIAALLDEDEAEQDLEHRRSKKRRRLDRIGDDEGDGLTRESLFDTDEERLDLGEDDDNETDRRSSIVDMDDFPPLQSGTGALPASTGTASSKRSSKPKGKGAGGAGAGGGAMTAGMSAKQAWSRMTKDQKEMSKKAEMLAQGATVQQLAEADGTTTLPAAVLGAGAGFDDVGLGAGDVNALEASGVAPNTQDPRGVSEAEAKVRLGLVEELQRQAWAAIVRDVPRMYRVYQSYDTFAKQDKLRVGQACMRNAFTQRQMKPTFRSAARINKEAASKAKRVIKEMLLYWRKNEKEELAARKKAEKEALEKAKAEEEAREAKRQSRKLNFLLTQTELYSHFIGKKIKTAEAERPDGEDTGAAAPDEGQVGYDRLEEVARGANGDLGLDDHGEPLPDIDYDDDDEENLRRHAARGAQAAVQAAKDKARAFDEAMPGAKKKEEALPIDLDGDELNFQNPSLGADSVTITQPKMLMAQLKEYQLKGLTWLGNLYEQGINGILADEMGLGKTIQSISLLAYLAEHHNLWGPFLVIAPSSTLHNWQQELSRFVPRLKAIPYWGAPKDRETLRRIWSRKNMTFDEDSPFHILITSYQLAVLDEKYLSGVKWQYMILDEAQAIKSASSARWKSLLTLPCRNRLLLTGTPIQNSMHELWALLHFIMPSLFDSHEEFSEWFSKDIENAAGGQGGTLQPEQLRRLHMILKPFMLRRVKKHVQKELGDKIEIDVLVDLSQRQRAIYKALRTRVSVSDLIAQASNSIDANSNSSSTKNLMNLVMQFRKVCNHPDLFERADVVSPLMFGTFSQSNLSREGDGMYLPDSAKNAIQPELPRLLWDEKLDRVSEDSEAGGEGWVLRNLCNIWRPDWISRRLKDEEVAGWGFLRIKEDSAESVCRKARAHPLITMLDEAGERERVVERGAYESDRDFIASKRRKLSPLSPKVPTTRLSNDTALRDISSVAWNTSFLSRPEARFTVEAAVAPFLRPFISSRSYINTQTRLSSDPLTKMAMYGATPSELHSPSSIARLHTLLPHLPPTGLFASSPASQNISPRMLIPPIKRLIVDSAKLARLDDLLRELKAGGHRVLLYFQMTRMMDLVEEYLIYRQYKYLRLDGGSAIGDRRDMVTNWQTNPDFFVFCLSTRAGGLGINLTAADTVIFYDHDWNPSNDAQAMDRAHRVGQTKQVTVYRLIARGTIEERIVKLARAKKDVQDIVVGTKSLTDVAKPSEIVSLFMDDEELAESVAKRKQAEAHGYVAPTTTTRVKSAFGDGLGLGTGGDDEDDFFSLKKTVANGEDEDFGDEAGSGPGGNGTPTGAGGTGGAAGGGGSKKKSSGGSKRKAPAGESGEKKSAPKKKKVKIAVGPDGLPI